MIKIDHTPTSFMTEFGNPDGTVKENFLKILHDEFQSEAKTMLKPMNRSYIVDENNSVFYWTVLAYFARNKKFFDSPAVYNKDSISLEKGLLIAGNHGVGKTFMFRCLHRMNELIALTGNSFSMITSNEAVERFQQEKRRSVAQFVGGQRYFDDIGAEEEASNYGKTDIFRIILEMRYDEFIDRQNKTFFTTNLSLDELSVRYGDRAESRIHEMFNLVHADGVDFRKNK